LTRFCREAPPEFTHPQRDVFCVFSGEGVSRLREYLKRLAEDQEREGRVSREESAMYSEAEADSSRDTISDDETIDAPEEAAERRPTLLPRPGGFRSYADVLLGGGSNSPDREDDRNGNGEGVRLSYPRTGRMSALFRRRSSRAGSFNEHDNGPSLREYLNGHVRRETSRSVSEGQGSSSRARFTHSEVPTFDNYFPARAEAQSRRPLPPRPHWPPQAHTAQFFGGEQQTPATGWREVPNLEDSSNAMRRMRQGPGPGQIGIHSQEDLAASALYDTDDDDGDDGEMTVRQSSRRYREMDGEMES
jgi:hypothetical protein